MSRWRQGWVVVTGSIVLFPAGDAQAAVPPAWQRVGEFTAVITVAAKAFGEAPIDEVERVDENRYQVRAGACSLEVRVRPKARSKPGPQTVEATPGPISCRR
jgi:hypothetical protein